MEFEEILNNRHSIRDFTNQTINSKDLETIVTAAGKTPSWANDQIWKVVIATGSSLNKIKEYHLSAKINGKPVQSEFPYMHRDSMGLQGRKNVVTWSSGLQKFLGPESIQMEQDSNILFNAPTVAYLLMPSKSSLWSAYDLGAFGQTLMLAAANLGIDSMPAAEFVSFPSELHKILEVPNDYQFGMGIGLGYRSDSKINQFRSKRMDLDRFLTIKN